MRSIVAGLVVSLFALALAVGSKTETAESITLPCTVRLAPGASVGNAVRSARPGEVICLEPGWHVGKGLVIDSSKPGLTIRGAGAGAVLASDGSIDVAIVVNTRGIAFENLIIAGGGPAGVYVSNSQDVAFRNVAVGFNGIGLHLDSGTAATVTDSIIAGNIHDGILVRNGSSGTLAGNQVFSNGGVGVSVVGHTGPLMVKGNQITNNVGPGFFAGQPPCALLPAGQLAAPSCYLWDLPAYVGGSNVTLEDNVVRGNRSTGLVFFPGTTGLLRRNDVSENLLTGLFVWGARVDAYKNAFVKNEEHAIEYRAYPDPLHFGRLPGAYPRRATGIVSGNTVKETYRWGSILGGGILSQGAEIKVRDNDIRRNAGIAVSFVNRAKGEIRSNSILQNGGSAVCLSPDSTASVSSNLVFGNLVNKTGVCAEAAP
ncbi:MAG: right-handed parallel beta-helix repeat-containing protein [Dehalococcoidia bacterium]|nr:right-handed parallel beta-helix repeat-containing protein [Dehalococcoidia bacterium]